MAIIFKSKISKIGKKECGFIYLNKEHKNKFKFGQQLKISAQLPNNKIVFFAKLRRYGRPGVYVPAKIVKKHKLLSKSTMLTFEKINGFFTKTSYDGRIYLPQEEVKKLNLKQDEIIRVEGVIEGKKYSEFCRIRIRRRFKTIECFCMFNPSLTKKEGIFNIKSIISRNNYKIPKVVKRIVKDFNYAPLEKNKVVAYYGNRVPVIIKTNFDMKKIAYYLGCFFSDGTKKGNSWGVCASTFEQAKCFLKMHKFLIKNPILNIELTYTDPFRENKEKLKNRLNRLWLKKTGLNIPKKRIWIYGTKVKDAQNRNVYGALSIREHRQLVLIYYNRLLNYFLKTIIEKKNKKLALDFILGVLEGDGSPSAKSRGNIVISTNKKEVKTLIQLFKILNLKHEGYAEKQNRCYIRIGSLELIEKVDLIKDKLFRFYPKRRKRTIERLLLTGAARYLTGKQSTTSAWILKRFREKRILNKENKLTMKGKKIKQALLKLEKEIL